MFQPFTFARQQQLPAGYPGYYGQPGIVPAGFVPIANLATPWVSPSGQIAPAGQVTSPVVYYQSLSTAMQLLIVASAGFSAWHGYKRNHDSVGWGFAWMGLGALFPVITPIVALAEGYAKPAGR